MDLIELICFQTLPRISSTLFKVFYEIYYRCFSGLFKRGINSRYIYTYFYFQKFHYFLEAIMLTIEASIYGIPLITTAKNTLNPGLISKLDDASSLN